MTRANLRTALLFVVGVSVGHASPIREFALNPRAVIDLNISQEVTTIVFPAPITALAGARMLIDGGRSAMEIEEGAAYRFHVSHAPSSNFVLVRSLSTGAEARLTAIFKNDAYVFNLRSVAEGSIASAILSEATQRVAERVELPPAAVKFSPKIGLSLLDRARAYPVLAQSLPKAVEGVVREATRRTVEIDGLKIEVQEVYRFPREDALVFLLELTNTGDARLDVIPSTFAVRIGAERYDQSIARGPAALLPGETAEAEFAIVGMIDGTRHDLSADNSFTILINTARHDEPSPPQGETPDGDLAPE